MAQAQTESLVTAERITLHSTVLGEERKVVVRLPEGYDTSETRYPVLYLLDGEFFFQQAAAAVQFLSENAYVDYAAINQPIPKLIVVGIVNVDRNRDFTPTHAPVQGQSRFPTSGEAEEFLDFLETELIPLIDGRYRTHQYRILSGWSLGGLLTVHAFLDRPGLFSAYLAISGSSPKGRIRSWYRVRCHASRSSSRSVPRRAAA
jgi:predicted alpha/beta superfamily hydrolase